MSAYGIGHLHTIEMGPPIVEYLERIDQRWRPTAAASWSTAPSRRSSRAPGAAT